MNLADTVKKNRKAMYLVGTLLFILTITNFWIKDLDPDILWHYVLGGEILESGISSKDTLSWLPNLVWPQLEWLYEVLLYIVSYYGGAIGFLVLFVITKYGQLWAALVFNKDAKSYLGLAVYSIVWMVLLPTNRGNRPSEVSALVFIYLLYKLVNNRKRLYLELLLIGCLTANLHGGMLAFMLGTILIVAASQLITFMIHKDKTYIVKAAETFIGFITFFIGSLVSAESISAYKVSFLGQSLSSSGFITEWDPYSPNYITGIMILLLIIVVASSKEFREFSEHAIISLALISAFTIGTLTTSRMAMYLIIAALLFGYKYFEDFLVDVVGKITNHRVPMIWQRFRGHIQFTGYLFFVFIMVSIFKIPEASLGSFDAFVQARSTWSTEVIDYLKENNITSGICNDYNNGNWLAYNGVKDFIDTRQHPFVEEFSNTTALNDWGSAYFSSNQAEEMKKLFDKYDTKYYYCTVSGEAKTNLAENIVKLGGWEIIVEDKNNIKDSKDYLLKRVEE